MITEVAILYVQPEWQKSFVNDFKAAGKYINASKGYKGHSLKKCLEADNKYILIALWESVDAHEKGFRGSEAYQEWKNLLHRYYEPHPVVEHYVDVVPL